MSINGQTFFYCNVVKKEIAGKDIKDRKANILNTSLKDVFQMSGGVILIKHLLYVFPKH